MNKFFKTIKEVLADWGHRQRQLPSRNESLKSEVLDNLQSTHPMLSKTLPQRGRTPWLSLAFTGLALISLVVDGLLPFGTSRVKTFSNKDIEFSRPLSIQKSDSLFFMPPQGHKVSVTDNREFIRTDYSASVRTRHVDDLVEAVGGVVHILGGRVDSSNSSKQYGYINFVVSAEKFEYFRRSIKNLAGGRFLVENIYTENLLPQKQSIEKQQKDVEETLAKLKSEKNKLSTSHKQAAASIQLKINKVDEKIVAVTIKLDVTNNPSERELLKTEEKKLLGEKNAFEAELASENTSYSDKLYLLDLQIRENRIILDNTVKEDQKLIETVATVRGTISFSWINVWQIIMIYIPINFAFLGFGVAAIIVYIIHRRRSYLFLPD